MQIKIEIPAAAAGVHADQAGLVGFVNGRLKVEMLVVELTTDVDVGGMRAHGEAGDQRAFHQLVRIVAHDVAILAGARLAFIRIDHQIGRASIGNLRHEGPFHAGGKTRAATSPQARLGHGGDHVLGGHRQATVQQRAVIGFTAKEHRLRRMNGGACQGMDVRQIVAWQASRIGDLRRRITPFQSLDDLPDRNRRQVCEHHVVDEHRRFVVAQPDARGFEQAEIGRPGPAESCPGVEFQGLIDLLVAVHFRDDVVAQINPVTARRCGVEEMVERRGLENILDGQPEPIGYPGGGFDGDVAGFALHLPQDVEERAAVWLMPVENGRDTGSHRCCHTLTSATVWSSVSRAARSLITALNSLAPWAPSADMIQLNVVGISARSGAVADECRPSIGPVER